MKRTGAVRPRSAAAAAGSMEPLAVSVHDDGEWAVVHRCRGCATVRVNRIAGDDNSYVLMRLHNLGDVR